MASTATVANGGLMEPADIDDLPRARHTPRVRLGLRSVYLAKKTTTRAREGYSVNILQIKLPLLHYSIN